MGLTKCDPYARRFLRSTFFGSNELHFTAEALWTLMHAECSPSFRQDFKVSQVRADGGVIGGFEFKWNNFESTCGKFMITKSDGDDIDKHGHLLNTEGAYAEMFTKHHYYRSSDGGKDCTNTRVRPTGLARPDSRRALVQLERRAFHSSSLDAHACVLLCITSTGELFLAGTA